MLLPEHVEKMLCSNVKRNIQKVLTGKSKSEDLWFFSPNYIIKNIESLGCEYRKDVNACSLRLGSFKYGNSEFELSWDDIDKNYVILKSI